MYKRYCLEKRNYGGDGLYFFVKSGKMFHSGKASPFMCSSHTACSKHSPLLEGAKLAILVRKKKHLSNYCTQTSLLKNQSFATALPSFKNCCFEGYEI